MKPEEALGEIDDEVIDMYNITLTKEKERLKVQGEDSTLFFKDVEVIESDETYELSGEEHIFLTIWKDVKVLVGSMYTEEP